MKIEKILNNNVVIILNERQEETIMMGRGLGFKKKNGDLLDEHLVEKVFSLNSNDLNNRFKELLAEIPVACMISSEQVITLAEERLPGKLHSSIHISLTDHIHFALQRHAGGITIKNVLLWEIKKQYPQEFAVGLEALSIIKQQMHVTLPEDEAGFIALHLVSAQLNDNMQNTIQVTRVMQEIMHIVKFHFRLEYNEDALSYHRFVTHLKFFAQRLLGKNPVTSDDDSLYQAVKTKYHEAFRCAEKIDSHVQHHYQHHLTTEEMLFLTIHIERVRSESL